MRLRLLPLLLFFVLGLFMFEAKAISYGYSYMEIYQDDPAAGLKVYAETGTVLDYDVWEYYDPGIQAYLFEGGGLIASTERIMNYDGPVVYVYTEPPINANYGSTYTIHGDHYLGTLVGYSTGNGWIYYDPYGFNFYAGTFPSPYNFSQGPALWYTYRIFRVATTQVSLTALRPLHLDSIDTTGGVPGSSFLTTLRGTGFFGNGQGASQTVQISGKGVSATVQPTSPNTIEVLEVQITIDSNADPGDRDLTLTVNGQTSNSINFRVGDYSPQIASISPDEGDTGDEVSVTITGSYFGFNPDVEIDGLGVARAITSSTTTSIEAIFSISDTTYEGLRGVKVRSRGVTGTGFMTVPGNSDRSNSVDFGVLAARPKVIFPEIGSVEKGSVKTITVRTENAPSTLTTRLSFKNKPDPPPMKPSGGWTTGKAIFVDSNGNDVQEISYTGDQPQQIQIRGLERSTSTNNVKLEARFDNNTQVEKDKGFTVSSVEFAEDDDCNGVDLVEFDKTLDYNERYLFIKRGNNNTIKMKVVPSGASGNFKLEPAEVNITLSQTTINSTSSQVVTVSANATASQTTNIKVKADNTSSLTREAEVLNIITDRQKGVTVELYAVSEDNDDVAAVPPGTGTPNTVAYVFSEGPNNFIDTVAGGDDWLATVPIGQRPPGYSSRSRRVITGANGILETLPQGDDAMYSSKDDELMQLYAPVTEMGNGLADIVCITSGPNNFLDSKVSRRDYEAVDPNNPSLMVIMSGADGRCDTDVNDDDIEAPGRMTNPSSAASFAEDLEDYLNDNIWLKQANVTVTVNPTVHPLDRNFDLDRDKELLYPGNTEYSRISSMQNPPVGTYNLYFTNLRVTQDDVLGISLRPGQHSYYGKQFWDLSNDNRRFSVIAHEIGHLFGSRHTAEDSDTEEVKEFYKPDVMYYANLTTVTQCRIRKPQWDTTTNLP
ncbi:MAG: hypothetical protein R2747_18070 [Pyrinomonadaceae bacterium]